MLNDVHAPPLSPPANASSSMRADKRAAQSADRAHALEQSAEHQGGTNLVFTDPEDRGDSFNTTLSAIVVGSVLIIAATLAWLMWK